MLTCALLLVQLSTCDGKENNGSSDEYGRQE
jgi:hypothetical protein